MKWEIIKEKTEDHWLELKGSSGAQVQEQGKEWRTFWNMNAVCKWDGCIDLWRYSNGYEFDHECIDGCQCLVEYSHICDVKDFINSLVELNNIAFNFFDNGEREYLKNLQEKEESNE